MNETVIKTQDLTRKFGSFVAVDKLNFSVSAGEIIGFLGPNGCGKTTTFRMLLGLLTPSSGNATVLGLDVIKDTDQIRQQIGYMSQKFAIYDDLTVKENVSFYGGVYGVANSAAIDACLEFTGMAQHSKTLTRELATGWRQRLALSIALVHQPKLLFLDEPTSGVDPLARRDFWDMIYNLADQGVTVLVTTHYMDEAEYCGRVAMMREGKLLAMDTPLHLKHQIVTGKAAEIACTDIISMMDWCENQPIVQKYSLAGNHIKVILQKGVRKKDLRNNLDKDGVKYDNVSAAEPGLDDVFGLLARRSKLAEINP